MDRTQIERFVDGGPRLRRTCSGLTPEDLAAHPGPGKWSILELVVHLQDTDAIAIDRMKRVIAEENPTLLYADESAYVERLRSHDQSINDALTLFEVGRRQMARVLRKLPDEAFERAGTHNIAGRLTVAELIRTYNDHLDHHLKFLLDKRERLGKPITR